MSLLFQVVFATSRSTHHRLALDALRHLRGADAERWSELFLHHYRGYLTGSKAPDDQFKDFRNHVLHVRENYWGGAIGEATRWYGRTVDALRRQEWHDAVFSAGVLSHYFSDPFMPLHTGQSEQETQVHRALEWSVCKSYGELQQIIDLDHGGYPRVETPRAEGASPSDWLGRMIAAGAEAAHEHYQAIIDHYDLALGAKRPQAGMDAECKDRIARCLGLAVVGLARVFERAFAEAEIEPPPVENTLHGFFATLESPLRVVLNQFHDLNERMTIEAIYDEVQRTGKVVKNLPEDDREIRRLHAEEVLRIPLHQLDHQPTKPAGMLHGQGKPDAQYPNRLMTMPTVREDLNRPLALVYRNRPAAVEGSGWLEAGGRKPEVGSQDRVLPLAGTPAPRLSTKYSVPGTQYSAPITRPTVPLTPPRRFDVPATPAATTTSPAANPQTAIQNPKPPAPSTVAAPQFKFRLSPGHPVVDAPTIGSKTAGRLEKVGIVTVGDLLAADPEELAKKVGQKHITADTVCQWQRESSLNCRVPELYNHDAQILVASGITEPEELAAHTPEELLELVLPWCKSAEGQRVLRQQQPPDLAEVTQWIAWGGAARKLKAA